MSITNKVPFTKTLKVSTDDRGIFAQFLSQGEKLEENSLPIKRVYYVYNYGPGVVRGLHFHKKEWKYFTAVSGAAKILALNPKKPKEKFIFVTSSRKPDLVVIPPGFANGWVSLEDDTILLCASTSSIEESIKDDKRYDPYKWGDVWAVKER